MYWRPVAGTKLLLQEIIRVQRELRFTALKCDVTWRDIRERSLTLCKQEVKSFMMFPMQHYLLFINFIRFPLYTFLSWDVYTLVSSILTWKGLTVPRFSFISNTARYSLKTMSDECHGIASMCFIEFCPKTSDLWTCVIISVFFWNV